MEPRRRAIDLDSFQFGSHVVTRYDLSDFSCSQWLRVQPGTPCGLSDSEGFGHTEAHRIQNDVETVLRLCAHWRTKFAIRRYTSFCTQHHYPTDFHYPGSRHKQNDDISSSSSRNTTSDLRAHYKDLGPWPMRNFYLASSFSDQPQALQRGQRGEAQGTTSYWQ